MGMNGFLLQFKNRFDSLMFLYKAMFLPLSLYGVILTYLTQ